MLGVSKGIHYGIASLTSEGGSPKKSHKSSRKLSSHQKKKIQRRKRSHRRHMRQIRCQQLQERFQLASDPLGDREHGIASYLGECIPLDVPSIRLSSYVGTDEHGRGKFCLVTVPERFSTSSNTEILQWLYSRKGQAGF